MSTRLSEEPWGIARFMFAYLGVVLAAAFGGLLAVVAYPIIDAAPICRDDPVGLCLPAMSVLAWALATAGGAFLVAFFFRLGWQWAAWLVALAACLGQVVVETNQPGIAVAALLLPALAAGITFARPDRDPPPWVGRLRIGGLIVLMVQFLVWLVILLVRPL